MKKILIKSLVVTLTVFALLSCEETEKKVEQEKADPVAGYEVKGKIKGLEGDTVYLMRYDQNSVTQIDKAVVDEDNSFKFTGIVDKPQFYRIRFDGEKAVDLIFDNEKFSFIADATKPEIPVQVEGSKTNRDLIAYLNYFNGMLRERKRLEEAYFRMQTNQEQKKDSAQLIMSRLANFDKERDDYTIQYIDSIFPSKAIFFISSILNSAEHIDYQAELSRKLLKEYPGSQLAKDYNKSMENILLQRAENEEREKTGSLAIGKTAPEINLQNQNGESLALSSLKGNYVLLDFWASWCGPCRMENPNLVKTFKKYQDKSFKVYSVSLDSDKNAWLQAIKKDNLDHNGWYHVSDLKNWQSEVVQPYQIQGIPYTLLLDKEGKIIAKNLRGNQLDEKLKEIF